MNLMLFKFPVKSKLMFKCYFKHICIALYVIYISWKTIKKKLFMTHLVHLVSGGLTV